MAAQLLDRFGPDCAERRAVRKYHFDLLENLLLPHHFKFFLWLMFQPQTTNKKMHGRPHTEGSSAPAPEAAPLPAEWEEGGECTTQSLWANLSRELGLTQEQSERLQSQFRKIVSQPETSTWTSLLRLEEALSSIRRLREAVNSLAEYSHSHLEAVRSVLSPAQFIRLFVFLERHPGKVCEVGGLAAAAQREGGDSSKLPVDGSHKNNIK